LLQTLSGLYVRKGELGKAEKTLDRALDIERTALGQIHPNVASILTDKGMVLSRQKRCREAARAFDQARRVEHRYVSEMLPTLSDSQQLTFLNNGYVHDYAKALSLALVQADYAEVREATAVWLLNGKAVAQQALAQTMLVARDSADAAGDRRVQELLAVRSQLARLALSIPKAGQEERRQKQCDQLAERERELINALGLAGVRLTRPRPWTELADVRAKLDEGKVLVDFARFVPRNFDLDAFDQREAERYVAWVITARDGVHVVDLGPAEPIDAAVQALCQGLATAHKTISQSGEPEAERALRPALADVSRLVLKPLQTHIDKYRHWYISPDANLWRIPWEALLDGDQYLIEKHTISYLISGRDLLARPATVKKHDAPLIMADPDFDLEPKQAAELTVQLLGSAPADNQMVAALGNPQALRSASLIGRAARLPGTAAEAVAIRPKLQAYAGEEPWVYRGKNALEGVFKAWRSPKVVVLSTHGFFLEDRDTKQSGDLKLPENPLLRCGLLLAGCNERARASGKQEDGVLTGLEIVGCDLRGTELVVLSACETGLGQVRHGEGVAGLRQAFQLAGAQAVVASLWQVSDRDTAFLMSDFFDGLAKGKSKAEALREAQLARMKAHRDRDGAAHPFFWAAFTLTGR